MQRTGNLILDQWAEARLRRLRGWAVLSLLAGAAGVVAPPLFLGVLAIYAGKRANRALEGFRGADAGSQEVINRAGIAMGYMGVVLGILSWLAILVAFFTFGVFLPWLIYRQ